MATIQTAIRMFDGMTPALRSITNAMNMAVSSFESMQDASSKAVDVRELQAMRSEINKAEIAFNQIEQEIREADAAQQQFNSDIRNGGSATEGLLGKFKALVSVGAAIGVGRKLVQMSDEMTHTVARLNMINDELQTTVELQQMIYESAQRSAASYFGVADSVAKLGMNTGNVFRTNKELIYFSEMLNKSFLVAGINNQAIDSVMYNLTQALSAGVLRGQDFNAVLQNTPKILHYVATYLDVPFERIRDIAAEGRITADVVKNAMFMAADEINEKFNSIPWTWGGVWNVVSNQILMATQPILTAISFLANNWDMIKPIILGVAAATLVYIAAAHGATAATTAWAAAQAIFNAVMALNPIGLIIIGVILFISLIYAAVAAVNKFTGSTLSATGIIAGAFMAAFAFIGNLFIAAVNLVIDVAALIYNTIALVAEFIANVFVDPVGAIVRLFAGLADTVLAIIQSIASAIDTVSGSKLADAVGGWRNGLAGKVTDLVGEVQIEIPRIDNNALHIDRFGISDAYNKGYNWGAARSGQLSSMLDNLSNMEDMVGDIAGNTGKMADALEISEEDLKYLRDLAEREVIDRTVLRDVNVNLSNSFGDVRETADVDGIIDRMTTRLAEAIATEAEGSFSV